MSPVSKQSDGLYDSYTLLEEEDKIKILAHWSGETLEMSIEVRFTHQQP